jgi:predicted ATPase
MRVNRVKFHRFKKYRDTEIPIHKGVSLLAGGNNSGKSTILQGLAVWEFCRTILETERGVMSLYSGHTNQGIGLGQDEFAPVNVPSLKHLWTNLRTQRIDESDGYTLWIEVEWINDEENKRHLRMGMSLVNDRLFIKKLKSDVPEGENIPRMAYVPSFAGITAKEPRCTPAIMRRYIGQGLPGAVLRNLLLNLKLANEEKRAKERKQTGKRRLKSSFLRSLRRGDPFEILQILLRSVFSYGIRVKEFSEVYHTHITVLSYRGEMRKKRFQRLKDYNPRDLMVEGSGFLQWLTVLSLTLNPEISLVLLDEPDAHLHPALQEELLRELRDIAEKFNKQVIYSTHSAELIRHENHGHIIDVNRLNPKYLNTREQKIPLLAGIGSVYTPRLSDIQKHHRILFVENESDARLLRKFASILHKQLPDSFVVWPWASGHKERKYLHLELRKLIPDLMSISLVDRDFEAINTTSNDLDDKVYHDDVDNGFITRKLRRRHIEGYLLHPDAIARAAGKEPEEIESQISHKHALDISGRVVDQSEPESLLQANAKDILEEHEESVLHVYGVNKYDIVESMREDEVPKDIRIIVSEICARLGG